MTPPRLAPIRALAGTLAAVALSACGAGDSPTRDPASAHIPAWGTPATFDVGSWNLDGFGDPEIGPDDEALQQRRVREVISASAVDLWALQEVVDRRSFAALLAGLPGHDGLLADDRKVEGGTAWYRDFGDRLQKPALLWRRGALEVVAARVILTDEHHAFAGRPPLEVEVRIDPGGAALEAVVIVVHAKAAADEGSRQRRRRAADALYRYLDARWPTLPVWVLGDFNDDIDTSIVRGAPSPYRAFVDAAEWRFATGALSAQGERSTVGHTEMIDHHLVSDEVWGWYLEGSAEVWRVDRWIDDFGRTTTDHYPVLTRYTLPSP